MLRYRPRFRDPDRAARPANLAAAERISPGVTPVFAAPEELAMEVETPSVQTARRLADEMDAEVDPRRFRANVYVDLESDEGFGEDGFVGCSLRIGTKAVLSILERDPRCKMITLDPDTARSSPEILRKVAKVHEGMAGVYGAVLVEGTVPTGDPSSCSTS